MSEKVKTAVAKPGWKTTEFWLTLAAQFVGALLASGIIADGGLASKIIGGVVALLGLLGYQIQRGSVKKELQRTETAKVLAAGPKPESDPS